jgi:hypothetical protein
MRKLAALLAVLLLAVSFSACGSDDGDGSSATTTAEDSDDDNADDDNTDDTSDDTSGDDDFSELLEESSNIRIKVTYERDEGDSFTISQDGEGRQAFFSDDSVWIVDGDDVTSCNSLESEPTCSQLSGALATAATLPFTAILTLARTTVEGAARADGFGDESTEEIAGRTARCVTISFGGSFSACADEETGVLLKWDASADGNSSSLVATEVTEPDDSDFEVPEGASVETLPSLPNLSVPS